MDILERLEQARKLMDILSRVADAAERLHKIIVPALPKLKIPRLRGGSPNKDEVKKLYVELVEELKTERAAHEQTRQYLRWATNEIENVKEAMREWRKKAMAKQAQIRIANRKKR